MSDLTARLARPTFVARHTALLVPHHADGPQKHPPRAKRDDDAFPIRIKLAVPPEGLGKRLDEMMSWLRTNLPGNAHAVHSDRTIGGSAMAVYFLTIDDAAALLAALPDALPAVPGG